MTALVVAHQGGWDELLFVLVPISVFAGLLALANRRALRDEEQRALEQREAGEGTKPSDPD